MTSGGPTARVEIRGPIVREDLPGLTERVCTLLRAARPALLRCEVGGVGADAVAVDALARLQLAARRYGCRVRLVDASSELRDLVELMGLSDVLAD